MYSLRITITFMATKPLLSETEIQPETKLRSRVGIEVSERGFRHEGYNFLYFLEKRNSREPHFVSDLPFVPHFSLDLITFF